MNRHISLYRRGGQTLALASSTHGPNGLAFDNGWSAVRAGELADAELGALARRALAECGVLDRFPGYPEGPSVAALALGLKSERTFLNGTTSVGVIQTDEAIKVKATRKELGGFGSDTSMLEVTLSADADDDALGAAIREAFAVSS